MTPADPRYDWLSELPLTPGEPFLRMGTRGIDKADWLLRDSETPAELKLRAGLLETRPDFAQIEDGHGDVLAELIGEVEEHLGRPLDAGPTVAGVRPELAALAVTIPEDVQLLVRTEQHWRLIGGVLLFPDQWSLPDKLGLSISQVHAPTAGYSELLESKVDTFFDRLSVGRCIGRRNWFVHDAPTYFLDAHARTRQIDDPDECACLWIRSERQTLRRLAHCDAIVFTIKTQFAPLPQVVARPALAAGMAAYFEQAGDRLLDNKDVTGRTEALLAYLRS